MLILRIEKQSNIVPKPHKVAQLQAAMDNGRDYTVSEEHDPSLLLLQGTHQLGVATLFTEPIVYMMATEVLLHLSSGGGFCFPYPMCQAIPETANKPRMMKTVPQHRKFNLLADYLHRPRALSYSGGNARYYRIGRRAILGDQKRPGALRRGGQA